MEDRRGWVYSPEKRGTMDILWTCGSTLFICLWSMLHLNVPAKHDTQRTILWRKTRWLTLGVLAPEIPMLIACGQWASAKRNHGKMRRLGYKESQWTLEHSFFADMGGFELETLDRDPFPITAKQVTWLIENGFVDLPNITQKEIWDKSNADKFSKFLACFQTGFITIEAIVRTAHGLPISPLELCTIALALTSLTTTSFWIRKPLDVMSAITLHTECTIAEIRKCGGDTSTWMPGHRKSQLEFIEPRPYIFRKWSPIVERFIIRAGLQTQPMSRIPNDRDPQFSNSIQYLSMAFATFLFGSIHFIGWNFSFEKEWELWLWRINCCVVSGLLTLYGTVELIACFREGFQTMGMDTMNGFKLRWPTCLWFVVPGAVYGLGRSLLVVEVLYSMRSLPAGCFEQVKWLSVIPHL
ncbi:hypothetical protein B0J11DRAFT_259756 [Dendryphion nanum]|uniref:Uncharacterized protein n=1 Tax=Dendryphion nanum TaxID=256645 RepID=A0A9P9E452_9PLEO|nr:hypothetical protein B0J11DRAFT_259756 [Dendryphion nanum]